MKYQVYKRIRRKATILGMPALNFMFMIIFDVLIFMIGFSGFSIYKILIILVGWILSFILARFTFNNVNLKPSKIEDYKRR